MPTEKGWERMKYQSTLLAVTNMERSKAFYCGLLGREVVADFGANVTLSGGITLQTLDTWKGFLNTQKVTLPNNGGELSFGTAFFFILQFRIVTYLPSRSHLSMNNKRKRQNI